MADHYVSLNRGEQGMLSSDFTTGTSSTAGDQIELRVKDGASLTRKDVQIALNAFERFFQNAQQFSAAGFDVNP
jgi:hypothetical protein